MNKYNGIVNAPIANFTGYVSGDDLALWAQGTSLARISVVGETTLWKKSQHD